MGERTGELNEEAGGHKSTDQIRDEIKQTQRNISDTVDSIQFRLSPAHMMDEAKDTLRDAPRRAGEGLMNRIKDNPIPAAIAGLGLWMLFRNDKRNQQPDYNFDYRNAGPNYAPQGGYYGNDLPGYGYGFERGYDSPQSGRMAHVADSVKEGAHAMKEKAGDMVDSIGETAHDLGDRAQEMGEETWDRAEELGRRVSYQARTSGQQLWDTLEANPLILGAAGAVIGAILGASLPETDQENRLMGEAADSVKDTAKEYAQEGMDKAKHVATAATDAAAAVATKEVNKEIKDVKAQMNASQAAGSTGSSSASSGSSSSASTSPRSGSTGTTGSSTPGGSRTR